LPDVLRERVTTVTRERPTGHKQGVTPVTTRAPVCRAKGDTTILACERLAPLDEWRRGVPTGTPKEQPEVGDPAGLQVP
jgi:hypothetical protein